MPEYRHPRADADAPGHPPAQVHVSRGERAPVTDGAFEAPQSVAEAIAADHDTTAGSMRVDSAPLDGPEDADESDTDDGSDGDDADEDGTETVPTADLIEMGECPWCDGYEGDHVAQHASSAHPDRWNNYTEDG